MTGKSHRQFGYAWASALAIVMQPLWGWLGVAALFIGVRPGSTAPDWMECNGIIRHRTVTHMPWLWVMLFALSVTQVNHLEPTNIIACALIGFCLGAMSHWVGDLGTPMGVPLLWPTRRVSLKLWRTGGVSEKMPVLVAWGGVAAIAAGRFLIPSSVWDNLNAHIAMAGNIISHWVSGPLL